MYKGVYSILTGITMLVITKKTHTWKASLSGVNNSGSFFHIFFSLVPPLPPALSASSFLWVSLSSTLVISLGSGCGGPHGAALTQSSALWVPLHIPWCLCSPPPMYPSISHLAYKPLTSSPLSLPSLLSLLLCLRLKCCTHS